MKLHEEIKCARVPPVGKKWETEGANPRLEKRIPSRGPEWFRERETLDSCGLNHPSLLAFWRCCGLPLTQDWRKLAWGNVLETFWDRGKLLGWLQELLVRVMCEWGCTRERFRKCERADELAGKEDLASDARLTVRYSVYLIPFHSLDQSKCLLVWLIRLTKNSHVASGDALRCISSTWSSEFGIYQNPTSPRTRIRNPTSRHRGSHRLWFLRRLAVHPTVSNNSVWWPLTNSSEFFQVYFPSLSIFSFKAIVCPTTRKKLLLLPSANAVPNATAVETTRRPTIASSSMSVISIIVSEERESDCACVLGVEREKGWLRFLARGERILAPVDTQR